MPIHRGIVAASITELPTLSIGSVTNFNQDRATFNAIVSANYQSTTAKFQYNTTNNFAAYTEVTATGSPVTGQAVSVYYNITGLSAGTTYYVRAVISNGIGTVTSSSTSFTTWSLKTYLNSTAGSYSVSVPSITPTGGSAITPTITQILLYGGGGGIMRGGGGGGGYRLSSSHTSSTSGTQNISGTVGGGGAYGVIGTSNASAGGNTTLTIGSTTWTAGGGGAGSDPNGGAVGSGDNAAYGGGAGNGSGYTYFTGTYTQVIVGYNTVCDSYDKYGNCTASHQEAVYGNGDPIYANDPNRNAGGGGGGTDSAGAAAGYPDYGGTGGNGGGAYGLNGGNGGGGRGDSTNGGNGTTVAGGVVVGTGGNASTLNGVAGGVTFKYYGP